MGFEAWSEHKMAHVAALGEVAEQADREMRKMIRTLKAYRLHKKRCSSENRSGLRGFGAIDHRAGANCAGLLMYYSPKDSIGAGSL